MDMEIEIGRKTNIEKNNNTEIESFINELKAELDKNEPDFIPDVIYKEELSENSLALKYKNQLNDIITKCTEDLSYEREFYYFDYDSRKKEYYLEYYCDGEIERFPVSKEDMKGNSFTKGTFWKPISEDEVMLADFIKDGIKVRVDYALNRLDVQNKKELKNNGLSKNNQQLNRKK